jgi:circadian clock protein KaiC
MTDRRDSSRVGQSLSTGIKGLDDILSGGFAPNRLYLIEGVPGAGKTTLALQFLMEGATRGEPVLYVTLSETEDEIREVAESHGWNVDGIGIRELIPNEGNLQPDEQYTMFHPSEIELTETTKTILADVEAIKPLRVVFDSLSELRLLAGNPLRYRRQILALKQFFAGRKCTVLLLDDMTSTGHDLQVQSIAHGVLRLEQLYPEYGAERRRLMVMKYRGRKFRGGFHDYNIVHGGLEVYPRLVAGEHHPELISERLGTGVLELDELLGGGLERGTSSLVLGAAGTGKSSMAAQFAVAAADGGRTAAMFVFDERIDTLLTRAESLGIGIKQHYDAGRVIIRQIDPAELSPGEFVHTIRTCVEDHDVAVLVIDSLNGYLNAMPDERFLVIHLHELLMYLGQRNVATLLISAQQGLIGANMTSPVDASYLADSVIVLRYYESKGEVRQAISVLKKRGGHHERTIRDFQLGSDGIKVGKPLREFRGILTGTPVLEREEAINQPDL